MVVVLFGSSKKVKSKKLDDRVKRVVSVAQDEPLIYQGFRRCCPAKPLIFLDPTCNGLKGLS